MRGVHHCLPLAQLVPPEVRLANFEHAQQKVTKGGPGVDMTIAVQLCDMF